MKVISSRTFERDTKRLLKRNPRLIDGVKETLIRLASDPFQERLKTHKLKGRLKDSWSCSVEYDLRIVFEFVQENNEPAILLQTIGAHDDVY